MQGTVKSFLPSKRYGFVRGDDGIDYYLHEQDLVHAAPLHQGLRVEFEETATPKGYRARGVRVVSSPAGCRYETPPDIVETKGAELAEWELLESIPWIILGASRDSPEAAKAELRGHASAIGANALFRIEYFKTRGEEAGSGRGIHYFTIHNFRAVPGVVGRVTKTGGKTRTELAGLSERVAELSRRRADECKERRRKGFLCILGAGASTAACFAMLGPNLAALIPGAVLALLAKDFFRLQEVWLVPMGENTT
ncbi:MAG: cold shock domain-containing protein [Lysobacteraceae bacterium]|nr:MAG: cold shock domain-containing protein [Xanthomonadaceae bacterium]